MKHHDTIQQAYDALKPNESYWLLDNDYKRKYQYICECVEIRPPYGPQTIEYIADIARFMLTVNSRIFKR